MGEVLAEVKLSETHSVKFVRDSGGELSVLEVGHIDELEQRVDMEQLQGLTFSAKYEALAANAHQRDERVLSTLVAAEQQAAERIDVAAAPPSELPESERTDEAEPAAAANGEGGPALRTRGIDYTSDAAWWTRNFCSSSNVDATWCPTNVGWAHSGWEPTMYFQSACMAASSTAGAKHWVETWNGSSWVRGYSATNNPRYWSRKTYETNGTRRGGCDGDAANPHVHYSTRIRWATPAFKSDSDFPSNRSMEISNGVQGLTHDDKYWYFTATKTDAYGNHGRYWRVPFTSSLNNQPTYYANPWGSKWKHMGDPVHHDGTLYIPLEPGGGSASRGGVGLIDTDEWAYVAAAEWPLDSPQNSAEAGTGGTAPWIAYNPKDGLFYSSRYDATHLYKYAIARTWDGSKHVVMIAYKGSIALKDGSGNPVKMSAIQGGKFSASGKLYLTRHLIDGGISVVDVNNGRNQGFIPVNYDKSSGEEIEGLDILDTTYLGTPSISSQVHVVMIDVNAIDNDDLYIKHYDVADFGKL